MASPAPLSLLLTEEEAWGSSVSERGAVIIQLQPVGLPPRRGRSTIKGSPRTVPERLDRDHVASACMDLLRRLGTHNTSQRHPYLVEIAMKAPRSMLAWGAAAHGGALTEEYHQIIQNPLLSSGEQETWAYFASVLNGEPLPGAKEAAASGAAAARAGLLSISSLDALPGEEGLPTAHELQAVGFLPTLTTSQAYAVSALRDRRGIQAILRGVSTTSNSSGLPNPVSWTLVAGVDAFASPLHRAHALRALDGLRRRLLELPTGQQGRAAFLAEVEEAGPGTLLHYLVCRDPVLGPEMRALRRAAAAAAVEEAIAAAAAAAEAEAAGGPRSGVPEVAAVAPASRLPSVDVAAVATAALNGARAVFSAAANLFGPSSNSSSSSSNSKAGGAPTLAAEDASNARKRPRDALAPATSSAAGEALQGGAAADGGAEPAAKRKRGEEGGVGAAAAAAASSSVATTGSIWTMDADEEESWRWEAAAALEGVGGAASSASGSGSATVYSLSEAAAADVADLRSKTHSHIFLFGEGEAAIFDPRRVGSQKGNKADAPRTVQPLVDDVNALAYVLLTAGFRSPLPPPATAGLSVAEPRNALVARVRLIGGKLPADLETTFGVATRVPPSKPADVQDFQQVTIAVHAFVAALGAIAREHGPASVTPALRGVQALGPSSCLWVAVAAHRELSRLLLALPQARRPTLALTARDGMLGAEARLESGRQGRGGGASGKTAAVASGAGTRSSGAAHFLNTPAAAPIPIIEVVPARPPPGATAAASSSSSLAASRPPTVASARTAPPAPPAAEEDAFCMPLMRELIAYETFLPILTPREMRGLLHRKEDSTLSVALEPSSAVPLGSALPTLHACTRLSASSICPKTGGLELLPALRLAYRLVLQLKALPTAAARQPYLLTVANHLRDTVLYYAVAHDAVLAGELQYLLQG